MLKKLLIVQIPKFYGYEHSLLKAAESNYEEVLLVSEHCFSILTRAVLNKLGLIDLIDLISNNLLKRKLESLTSRHDEIDCLIVLGRGLNPVLWSLMKRLKVNLKFYLWDSILNINPSLALMEELSFVGRTFSFDESDCSQYGFKYLPVFSPKKLSSVNSRIFDLVHFASFTLHRFKSIEEFVKNYQTKKLNIIFFCTQSWSVFFKNIWRVFMFCFRASKKKILVVYLPFPLSNKIYYSLLSRAHCTLECRSENQSSPTQRLTDSVVYSLDCYDISYILSRNFYTVYNSSYFQDGRGAVCECREWINSIFVKDIIKAHQ